MKRIVTVGLAALLSACGKVAPLTPPPGQSLPVKPLTARATPNAEQLLQLPAMAKPGRVDELLTKSQPRKPDRFDLPPPDAGLAPTPSTIGPDNAEAPR